MFLVLGKGGVPLLHTPFDEGVYLGGALTAVNVVMELSNVVRECNNTVLSRACKLLSLSTPTFHCMS